MNAGHGSTNKQSRRRVMETDGSALSPYDVDLERTLSGGVELRGVPSGSQVRPLQHTPVRGRFRGGGGKARPISLSVPHTKPYCAAALRNFHVGEPFLLRHFTPHSVPQA